jgi:hypothetical protein
METLVRSVVWDLDTISEAGYRTDDANRRDGFSLSFNSSLCSVYGANGGFVRIPGSWRRRDRFVAFPQHLRPRIPRRRCRTPVTDNRAGDP